MPSSDFDGCATTYAERSASRLTAIRHPKFVVFRCVLLFGFGFFAIMFGFPLPSSAATRQPVKISRIGVLSSAGNSRLPGSQIEVFRKALADLGYSEGKDILVEYRYAEGNQERMPTLVTELVKLKVDVLVLTALTAVLAAKQATRTIPVVMIILSDPVATGVVDSLARPGGNITGFTRLTRELNGKRLELFKETIPGMSRAAVLWDANAPGAAAALKEYEAASRALNIKLESWELRGPNPNFEEPFRVAAKSPVAALVSINNALVRRHATRIAELAIKNRLPSMYEGRDYVTAGGLISYSANETEAYRRAALYVDKILKGAKPADLPIERPTQFELVVNLNTAKQIGVAIPQSVLARADKVIK
jgi:putative ABC transport system substrate-binding protein